MCTKAYTALDKGITYKYYYVFQNIGCNKLIWKVEVRLDLKLLCDKFRKIKIISVFFIVLNACSVKQARFYGYVGS